MQNKMLCRINICGRKIWLDNDNIHKTRPDYAEIVLLRDKKIYKTIKLNSSSDGIFCFPCLAVWKNQNQKYEYQVDEINTSLLYDKSVEGYKITNTLKNLVIPFSFIKTNKMTGMKLSGAIFELRQNNEIIATSTSDENGVVSFSVFAGSYQMKEIQSPKGFLNNDFIYEVEVDTEGNVVIDSIPITEFSVSNQPDPYIINLKRATDILEEYKIAPVTWPLNGGIAHNLFMLDKILIETQMTPLVVKWDYDIKDISYFQSGGGIDITASYTNGIPVSINNDYTVYIKFDNNHETIATIHIDNIRDGSTKLPYLLLNFPTAENIDMMIPGIGQFNMFYMQGGGIKLTKHYELYESIDMNLKDWQPIGETTYFSNFSGSLNGNNNIIFNLNVGYPGYTASAGLFTAIADGAIIENLGMRNCRLESKSWSAGGFVAYVNINLGGIIVLRNLTFEGTVFNESFPGSGGIAGYINGSKGFVQIDNCNVIGDISGDSAAGIIGFASLQNTGSLFISGCSSIGFATSARGNASGIIGFCNSSGGPLTIKSCNNSMKIIGDDIAGGIAGGISTAKNALISLCFNKGAIVGNCYVGGIAGYLNGETITTSLVIENCYNIGAIAVDGKINESYAGGIAGNCEGYTYIKNCYNTANIEATTSAGIKLNTGGICGRYGSVSNCVSIGNTIKNIQNRIARIAVSAGNTSQNLFNNMAFENMQVLINGIQKSPLDEGSTGTDGISINIETITTKDLYENTLGWDITSCWNFGNNAYLLPVLRTVPIDIQPAVLPDHLINN